MEREEHFCIQCRISQLRLGQGPPTPVGALLPLVQLDPELSPANGSQAEASFDLPSADMAYGLERVEHASKLEADLPQDASLERSIVYHFHDVLAGKDGYQWIQAAHGRAVDDDRCRR